MASNLISEEFIKHVAPDEAALSVVEPFVKDPIDLAAVYEAVIADLEPRDNPYLPNQVERLLDDVGGQIDRALRYRDTIYSYQERAVTASMELAAAGKAAIHLEQIQRAAWLGAQYTAAKAVEENIAAFGDEQPKDGGGAKGAGNKPTDGEGAIGLDDKFAQLTVTRARASIAVAEAVLSGDADRRALVDQYWKDEQTRRQLLADRYTTPSGSLNFKEKSDQYIALLKNDFGKIYNKCRAIRTGISDIYGVNVPDPVAPPEKDSTNDMLTQLTLWQRNCIESINQLRLDETEFEHTISLRNRPDADNPFFTKAAYENVLGPGGDLTLALDLRNHFPTALERLRVTAVGITITSDHTGKNAEGEADRASYLKVAVFPPTSAENVNRRPLLFDGVSSFSGLGYSRMRSGPQIENIDPKGVWTIRLGDFFYRLTIGEKVSFNNVINVQLHLRLRAQCPTPATELDWPKL